MSSKAGSDNIVGVCTSAEVDVTEEWFIVLHTTNHHIEPEWIEARAAIVQNSSEPSVKILRLHGDLVVHREVGENCLIDELLDVLEVCIVACDSQDDILIDFKDSVDVMVTSQVPV